ncbi:MAG: DUF4386 domain-containing protein [Acidobacteria bacterium]|nr:DUF4386 domain-containing protein [Acidobacteriota bacterium]
MSTTPAIQLTGRPSPKALARIAGLCQALEGTTATFGQVQVMGSLFVAGNAAASAGNIVAHERLFWLGFASSLLGAIFHIAWAVVMYFLLRPAGRKTSAFALSAILVGCAIQVVTAVLYVAPMVVLKGAAALSSFTAAQVQALAFTFMRLNSYAFNMYLVFFGLWCALTGVLIMRSRFMPRILGALLTISGIGWMTYLVPPVAVHLFIPYLAAASAIGEIPLLLWLLIAGVNNERWHQQARSAAA